MLLLLPEEGDLLQSRVVLLHFQFVGSVLLILGCGVVRLTVFCTVDADDLALFALLLGHGASCVGPKTGNLAL